MALFRSLRYSQYTMRAKQAVESAGAILVAVVIAMVQTPLADAQPKATQKNPAASPAARPRLQAAAKQSYSAAAIQAGEQPFLSQCGFCHGRDAAGGESGPDLTRSELVAQDVRGDKIGPVLSAGRADRGMPAFRLPQAEVDSIIAFIHGQVEKFAALGGGRRTVEPEDLATGNAADGRAYFTGTGGCTKCHSATGDLAGVGKRHRGLALMQRMLYPGSRSASASLRATFRLPAGETVVAPATGMDEFSVTVLDPLGQPQTYQRSAVNVEVDDPLAAHFTQMGKYTDTAIHNVYAYLSTLE
jgi:cytochrome c oxidase cbb3-type subunit III